MDSDCNVYGTSNLKVVDVSIMPVKVRVQRLVGSLE